MFLKDKSQIKSVLTDLLNEQIDLILKLSKADQTGW